MYARVVTISVRPERMDDCIQVFREVNGPAIAARPGFDHGHWWVDRTTGEAVSVTFWQTADDEVSSRANIPRLIDGMAAVLASQEIEQRVFERVHDQYPRAAVAGAREPRGVSLDATTPGGDGAAE